MKKEFDIEKFKMRYIAIHCKTEAEAIDFCNMLHDMGWRWGDGDNLYNNPNWDAHEKDTYYEANWWGKNSIFCSDTKYIFPNIEVIEWSDYMKGNLKEKYLVNGNVVELRDGRRCIIVDNKILHYNFCFTTNDFEDNLQHIGMTMGGWAIYDSKGYDVVKVFACPNSLDLARAHEVLWDRDKYEKSQVKEYTMEELAKKLGETIKIVKKH